jgi:hypothetical protein
MRILVIASGIAALTLTSLPAHAVSVEEYFSIQEQASVQNVQQDKARNSLNGLFAGLHDGIFSALYFGGGTIKHEGRKIVCLDNFRDLTQSAVRDALTETIGTYERQALSPAAASSMSIGMHAIIGLSRRFGCN